MGRTKIEWAKYTFNPWRGCERVSPACDHCYAATMAARNPAVLGRWGSFREGGTRVVAAEPYWREPLKWDRLASCICPTTNPVRHGADCPQSNRPRVFCASLADVFEQWQGPMVDASGHPIEWMDLDTYRRVYDLSHGLDRWVACKDEQMESASGVTMQDVRNRVFRLIDQTPNLDWLLLTKRVENVLAMMPTIRVGSQMSAAALESGAGFQVVIPRNMWIGTTVENQEQALRRIPHLVRVPAHVRFLSCEPLLGPLDLAAAGCGDSDLAWNRPEWVISGGESGPGARPSHPDWFRSLRDQCDQAGIPFFFKQWGDWATEPMADVEYGEFHGLEAESWVKSCECSKGTRKMLRVGKKAAGRLLDGREWNEVPK